MSTENVCNCPLSEVAKLLSEKPIVDRPYRIKGTDIDVGARDVKYRLDAVAALYMRVHGCPTETDALHAAMNDLGKLVWVPRMAQAETLPEMQAATKAIKEIFGI
jgi:hypothetical protein